LEKSSSEGAPQEREQRPSAELLKKHLIQTPNNGYNIIAYTRKSTSISTTRHMNSIEANKLN
jgi:hypothetical protein